MVTCLKPCIYWYVPHRLYYAGKGDFNAVKVPILIFTCSEDDLSVKY